MALRRSELGVDRLDLDRFVVQLENKYKCPICHELLRSPTQCPQGHVFCHECITIVANQPDCKCPMDRTSFLKSQLHPNLFVQNCINDLCIKCKHNIIPDSNEDERCIWSGPLHSLEKHENVDCLFRTIQCPNVDCTVSLQSRHLADHQQSCPNRITACQHCNSNVQFCQLAAHVEVCDLAPVLCPNGCGDSLVVRREHLPLCPLELVECPLYRINCCHNTYTSVIGDESSTTACSGSLRRRDLLAHMGNPTTLAETLVALCGKVQSLTDKQDSADRELDSLRRSVIPSQWGPSSTSTSNTTSRYDGPRLPPFTSMQLGGTGPSTQQTGTAASAGPARRTSLPVDPTEDEWLLEDWEVGPVRAPTVPTDAMSRVLTARRQADYLPRSRYSGGNRIDDINRGNGNYGGSSHRVSSADQRGGLGGGSPPFGFASMLSGSRRSHPAPPFRPPTPPPLPGISSGAQRLSTTSILSNSRRRTRDWENEDDPQQQQLRNVRARTESAAAGGSPENSLFAPAMSSAGRYPRTSLTLSSSALPPSTSRRSVDLNPQQRGGADILRSVGSETDSLGAPPSQSATATGSFVTRRGLAQSTRGRGTASDFSDSLLERIAAEQSGVDRDAQGYRRELVDLASSSSFSSSPRGEANIDRQITSGASHHGTTSTSDAVSSPSALLDVVNALETVAASSWTNNAFHEQHRDEDDVDDDEEEEDYEDMIGGGRFA